MGGELTAHTAHTAHASTTHLSHHLGHVHAAHACRLCRLVPRKKHLWKIGTSRGGSFFDKKRVGTLGSPPPPMPPMPPIPDVSKSSCPCVREYFRSSQKGHNAQQIAVKWDCDNGRAWCAERGMGRRKKSRRNEGGRVAQRGDLRWDENAQVCGMRRVALEAMSKMQAGRVAAGSGGTWSPYTAKEVRDRQIKRMTRADRFSHSLACVRHHDRLPAPESMAIAGRNSRHRRPRPHPSTCPSRPSGSQSWCPSGACPSTRPPPCGRVRQTHRVLRWPTCSPQD